MRIFFVTHECCFFRGRQKEALLFRFELVVDKCFDSSADIIFILLRLCTGNSNESQTSFRILFSPFDIADKL